MRPLGQRIVFFRDGVSEGQFQLILRDELPLLRKAFESLGDGSYRPRVTFVIVQKRCAGSASPSPRCGLNSAPPCPQPPHAPVLQRGRCRPQRQRAARHGGGLGHRAPARVFFFPGQPRGHPGDVSPRALPRAAGRCAADDAARRRAQGRSRHLGRTENGYTADVMQNMCFSLCHLYCRCTRSVSIVPPGARAGGVRRPARAHSRAHAARQCTMLTWQPSAAGCCALQLAQTTTQCRHCRVPQARLAQLISPCMRR